MSHYGVVEIMDEKGGNRCYRNENFTQCMAGECIVYMCVCVRHRVERDDDEEEDKQRE